MADFYSHGRKVWRDPAFQKSKGLPIFRPYALIGSRCFVRSYFTATWVRSLKLCKATNCKPRAQWVADDVWGGARGSGPGAEAHRHPKTFGAEPFNPVGAWKLGRHHPPTHPGPFGAPERGRNPTCNPSEIKGLHVSVFKKFEGLQVGLRRPSWVPKGPRSFPFQAPKGPGSGSLPKNKETQDPLPLQIVKGSRIYTFSHPPKGARDPPPSQAPKGSTSAPLPREPQGA